MTEQDPLNRELLTEGDYVTDGPIDLTNCEKEPIHIPGYIQPHGVLLAINPIDDYRIAQCSRNTDQFLGISAEALLGQRLEALIGKAQFELMIHRDLQAIATPDLQYINLTIPVGDDPVAFFGIVHASEGLILLELELVSEDTVPFTDDFERIQTFFSRMKRTENRVEGSQVACELVKDILGYDRVMLYEFDDHWNGKVVAEAKKQELEPFLGHHYPASDIPRQARELYLRNWLRTIVDVSYTPVEIIPTVQPLTGKPLNLSLSALRSVSPLHIEYLHNMGVGATTTISLIHDNQLWGLITCHHYSRKYVSHRTRNLCNFLGSFFSNELYQRQQLDDYQTELRLRILSARFTEIFIGQTDVFHVIEQLDNEEQTLLDLMSATGAVVYYQDNLMLYGTTPTSKQVMELAGWLSARAEDYTYHSSKLSAEYEPAKAYRDIASGVLYLALSPGQQNYVMWFRPEVVQIVDWAGDPAKAVIQEEDKVRLSPRKSFEKWRQVVEGTSYSWKSQELSVLPQLKSIVRKQTDDQLRQAKEQAIQNARIFRENEERYLQLMGLSPVAFLSLTTAGTIMYCNPQAESLFGAKKPEELLQLEIYRLAREDSRDDLREQIKRMEQNQAQLVSGSGRFVTLEGNGIELEFMLAAIHQGRKSSIMVILREGTAEDGPDRVYSDVLDQLQNYVTTDPLTELPNPLTFEKELSMDWEECVQNKLPLALMMVDIDDFRVYNTLHGLYGGDLCLQWIADALKIIGEHYGASISRYGGGTFILKLKNESPERTYELAEKIRLGVLALSIPKDRSAEDGFMTVSVGAACLTPASMLKFTDLIAETEKAMHMAKSKGKNRVTLHGCDAD
ncbi:diguanylate cyclase [Paenibacillus sp. p3-SID867]|uniref:diguanylate cyclase domain-containing protein n=1 Tax=Paenibacillus sp. p3-SID867 TaxID=2916363 RepID=UPI0021A28AA3|nr:diguanylate cyclase [Paenibacillus sp. p3-SID867]MCT1399086.1 diguanylate cyclase [Paenibacillus sp. p3-SID867]